jgi:hypothetical protein
MSTIKSSAENLTLNADGANNDIKFQSNGVEKASIDQDGNLVLSGTLTSVGIDDNANATAITIDSSEKVRIGNTTTFENGFNDLCVGSVSGTHGITLASENNATGTLAFADGDSSYGGHFQYNHSDNAFKFYTADTVRARIDSDGLKFNTDTAAANALDDYEEGTWTPTIYMGSGTAATTNTLAYTKVGRVVTISGQYRITSASSPDGSYNISLPFTVASGDGMYAAGTYRTYDVDTPNDGVSPVIFADQGQAKATLQWSRDGSSSTEERATLNGYFMIGLTYFT